MATVVNTSGMDVLAGFAPEEISEFVDYLTRIIRNVEASSPQRRHVHTHD